MKDISTEARHVMDFINISGGAVFKSSLPRMNGLIDSAVSELESLNAITIKTSNDYKTVLTLNKWTSKNCNH